MATGAIFDLLVYAMGLPMKANSWCHFEYNLWTDNVDFVYICHIQWDVFDCCIFNYEIMPATLANTFLFILQGSLNLLADLGYGGRF